jgi:hypothetical protein
MAAAIAGHLLEPGPTAGVETLLRAGRRRWGGRAPTVAARRLTSVDAEVERLRHYVDRPTGVRLVVGSTDGFTELDLDRSRRRNVPAPGIREDAPVMTMVGRDGWLAFTDVGRQGWTAGTDLGPPFAPLGTGAVFPGLDHDTVWVLSNLGTVAELDRSGRVRRGPYRVPARPDTYAGSVVTGVAQAGAVIARSDRGWTDVFDLVHQRVVRRLPGPAIAVHGNLVAWLDGGEDVNLRMTDLGDGHETLVLPGVGASTEAAFSPDGRFLAVAGSSEVLVAELGTSRVDKAPTRGMPSRLTWDPSARWLFFSSPGITGWDAQLHEVFHPRIPGLPYQPYLLAAVPA